MGSWRKALVGTGIGVLALTTFVAATPEPVAASGEIAPPVVVTGDSLSHQAEDEIREALAARGYRNVRFAVYGGTTIGWSLDRIREGREPIVVLASGSMHAHGGWTAADDADAQRAVSVLSDRPCAVWVLPAAARYPGGVRRHEAAVAATAAGIRRAVTGSAVHLADWAEVADALPEIHVWDGVHHTLGGQDLYGRLIADTVAARCRGVDPATPARDQRYVDSVHRTLLNRSATATEARSWADRLTHGHPRIAFARRLGTTPEWVDRQIDQLYRQALDRSADPSGRAYWRDLVVAGRPFHDVAAHVFGSAEMHARAGGTNAGFIEALYQRLLHRASDEQGRRHWSSQLAAGLPRPTVAAAFHSSLESRRDRVDALYRTILGRAPDRAGLDHWAAALRTVGDLRLAATLVASDEAYARAQG